MTKVEQKVALQAVFLNRVSRLARIREDLADSIYDDPKRLVDKALYSAFNDCRTVGVVRKAKAILKDSGSLPPIPPEPTIEIDIPNVISESQQESMFLARLKRNQEQKVRYGNELTPDAVHLINWAFNSNYGDSVRLGKRKEAREILELDKHEQPAPTLKALKDVTAVQSNTEQPASPDSTTETEELSISLPDTNELKMLEVFLARLKRASEYRKTYGNELHEDARALVDRALNSAYWDCVRLGKRYEAREVLGLPQDEVQQRAA